MTYNFIESLIPDIDIYPDVIENYQMGALTIGDLHACFPKFLYFLTRYGIINLTPETYTNLIECYRCPIDMIYEQDLIKFRENINKIELIRPDVLIRLLGDETADRGMNDYFILFFISRLVAEQKRLTGKINLVIIFSNHGAEFINAYEQYQTNNDSYNNIGCIFSDFYIMRSVYCLNALIYSPMNLLTWDDIYQLITSSYQPCLKLIDYEYYPEQKIINIFSHAPIDTNAFEVLSKLFYCKYDQSNIKAFLTSLDAINSSFSNIVMSNQVHNYYSPPQLNNEKPFQHLFIEKHIYENKTPHTILCAIVWNRHAVLQRYLKLFPDHTIQFIHGHTATTQEDIIRDRDARVFNLNDSCGKVPTTDWSWHKRQTIKLFLSLPISYQNIESDQISLSEQDPNEILHLSDQDDFIPITKSHSARNLFFYSRTLDDFFLELDNTCDHTEDTKVTEDTLSTDDSCDSADDIFLAPNR